MNHCNMHPSLRRFTKSFVIFAQATASAQPRHRSFYYPSFGQHFELMTSSRTFDDFQQPAGMGLDPVNQLPSVSRVGPDQLEPRGSPDQPVQDQFGSMPILDIGGLDYDSQQHSHGVYDDMPFASHHLLARIIAARPPFPVVFTDWMSMMAALGVGCLPSACRTLGRSISGTRSQVPSCLHFRKYHHTVPQGGRSCGNARHVHPFRRTYTMPLTTSRRSTVRCLPSGFAGGSKGASSFHWSSLRSLGYGLRFMPHSLIQI